MSITLYSKTVCPSCATAKRVLKAEGIPFDEINVEHDEAALRRIKDKGFLTAPVFHYNGEYRAMDGLRDIISAWKERTA